MAERVVSWAAVANFSAISREARKAKKDLEALRKEQALFRQERTATNRSGNSGNAANAYRDQAKAIHETTSALRDASELTRRLREAQVRQVEAMRSQERAADRSFSSFLRLSVGTDNLTSANKKFQRNRIDGDLRDMADASRYAGRSMRDVDRSLSSTARSSRLMSRSVQDVDGAFVQYGRTVRRARTETDGYGGSVRRLRSDVGGLHPQIARANISLSAMSRVIRATRWPLILTGVNILSAALGPLTAGFLGLAGAISPVVGLLGGLPGLMTAAAGGIGTLIAGFAGIGGALKEYATNQKNATKIGNTAAKAQQTAAKRAQTAARQQRDAAQRVARAERDAADTARQNARSIANARQDLADANERAGDSAIQSARQIQSAERGIGEAQLRAISAQRNLDSARDDARRNIDDLRQSLKDLALEEEGASLTVEESRQRLRQVLNDPGSTDLERRQADLAVREAEARLGDVRKSQKDNDKALKDAQRKGVEGSDQVVQARQDEADAVLAVIDAQTALADAKKDAARAERDASRAVVEANRNLEDARRAAKQNTIQSNEAIADAKVKVDDLSTAIDTGAVPAVDKFKEAMAKLTPEARAVVLQLIAMKPLIDQLRATAQRGMLPGVLSFLRDSVVLFPLLNGFVDKAARSFGDFFRESGKALTTAGAMDRWGKILDSTNVVLDDFIAAGKNVAGVLGDILTAGAGPGGLTEWLSGTVRGWTESWKAMTSGEEGQKRLKTFFDDAMGVASQLGRIVRNVAKTLFGLGKGTRKVGDWILQSLEDLTAEWERWVNSDTGQNWLEDWADRAIVTLDLLADTVSGVFKAFQEAGKNIDLDQILTEINTKLIPALAGVLKIFTGELAINLVNLLTNIANIIAAFGPDGGGFLNLFVSALEGISGVMAEILKNKGAVHIISALMLAFAVKKAAAIAATVTGLTGLGKAVGQVSDKGGGFGGAKGARQTKSTAGRVAGRVTSVGMTAAGLGGFVPNRAASEVANRTVRDRVKIEERTKAKIQRQVDESGARRGGKGSMATQPTARRAAPQAPKGSLLERLFRKGSAAPQPTAAPRRAASAEGAVPSNIAGKAAAGGKGVGKATTDGLTSGMSGKGAASRITSIAQQVIAAAKKTLGIRSPSTVFIEIGRMIAQGLIRGMSSLQGQVSTAAATLSGAAVAGGKAGAGVKGGGKGSGKASKGSSKASKGSGVAVAAPKAKKAPRGGGASEDGGAGKLASGAMKAGGAIGTLALLLSFLPGPLGEVAAKASTAIFVLSLLTPVFSAIGKGLLKLVPLLKTIGGLVLKFGKILGSTFMMIAKVVARAMMLIGRAMLANPWMLLITALIIIVVLVIKYWDQIKAAVVKAVSFMLNWLKRNWQTLIKIILGPLGFLIVAIVRNWDKISAGFMAALRKTLAAVKAVWAWIKKWILDPIVSAAVAVFKKVAEFQAGLKTRLTNLVNAIKKIFAKVTNFLANPFNVTSKVSGFLSALKSKIDEWVGKIGSAWAKLKSAAQAPINFIVDTVLNGGLLKAYNWVAKKLGLEEVAPIDLSAKKGGSGSSKGNTGRVTRGLATGGYAGGKTRGVLRGPGTGTSDSILGVDESGMPTARVSKGEFVVRKKMTDRFRPVLEAINSGKAAIGGFARGGITKGLQALAKGGIVWPGNTKNLSNNYSGHSGIDIAASQGSPIYAAADGRIYYAGYGRGYGQAIFERSNSGTNMVYGHSSQMNVKAGDSVRAGQTIGLVGATGNASGPHIHFEIAPNGFNKVSNREATLAWLRGSNITSEGGGTAITGEAGPSMLSRLIERATAPLKGLGNKVLDSPLGQMAAAVPKKLFNMMKAKVSGAESGTGAGSPGTPEGSGVARWGRMVSAGLRRVGLPQSLHDNFMRQIASESGGNEKIMQQIHDVNSGGNEAAGLLQIIPGTFRAYRDPALPNDRLNAWANIVASMRYVKSRYGSSAESVIGHGHGYARGTAGASPGWRWVGEDGPELMKFKGGERVKSNKKSNDVPGYHMGGTVAEAKNLQPIRGFVKNTFGWFVKAMRSQLYMGGSTKWDKALDTRLRGLKGGTISPVGSFSPPKTFIGKAIEYLRKGKKGYDLGGLAARTKKDPAYIWRAGAAISAEMARQGNKMVDTHYDVRRKKGESDKAYNSRLSKSAAYKRNRFNASRTRFTNERTRAVKDLEFRLGLPQDGIWGSEISAPLKHVLDHTYKRVHSNTSSQPWLGAGANSALMEQGRTNAINAEFDKLNKQFSGWNLAYVVRKFTELGPADSLDTMRQLVKNKAAATQYNSLLKTEYDRQDAIDNPDPTEAQIALFIKTINSGSRVGLQQASNAVSLSLDSGAALYDKINNKGGPGWGTTPANKLVRISEDVKQLRSLFKFANGGTVPGSGNGDTVPAMLTPREFVVRKKGAAAFEAAHGKGSMQYINHYDKYANGGFVAGGFEPPSITPSRTSVSYTKAGGSSSTNKVVNYYFNTEIKNPVAEKSSVSVQKRVTRVAKLGLLAGDEK